MKKPDYAAVTFEQATDCELRLAAKFAGLDQLGGHYFNAIVTENSQISKEQRDLLVEGLSRFGFKSIQVDANNRVKAIGSSQVSSDAAKPLRSYPE